MLISILTLFPEMFQGPFAYSIVKHAQEKKLVTINLINIRDFGKGKHKTVDDTPYGGGVGMVMRVDVVHDAIQYAIQLAPEKKHFVVLTSAKGKTYTQKTAHSFTKIEHLVIVCGHYEGIDERTLKFVDQEISIGNYIVTGGEIPAMIITDSVARLVEGVLKPEATMNESFSLEQSSQLLEYPQYTRPDNYNGLTVPNVLLSGNHKEIEKWRTKQSVRSPRRAVKRHSLN